MASYDVQITNTRAVAKHRDPVVVGLLTLVTLGIYAVYWWYQIARELRDLGQSRSTDLGKEPGLSALAFGLGWIIIVPFVITVYATCQRVQKAQEIAGTYGRLNGWVAGLLVVAGVFTGILFPLFPAYVQSQLNQVWESPTIGERLYAAHHPPGIPQPSATTPDPVAPPNPPPPAEEEPQPLAAADWYPDPTGQARLRYWDGSAWTHHTAN